MRRLALTALVVVFVLAAAGIAFAATPTVIGASGASTFTYQDLADANAKYSGGYAEFEPGFAPGKYFDGSALVVSTNDGGYATNPHGGYSAGSNKCKICHAVHRAEGAYYLLRADTQSDACDYCHIGDGAHSSKIVYDLNSAGTNTTNGHTMGAGQVPDSSIKQTVSPVTVEGIAFNGTDYGKVTETINVRSYDPKLISLYRFSRHHSQNPVGDGQDGFKPIGPNTLSCFSCHQPHNAGAQVWQPTSYVDGVAGLSVGAPLTSGYKLLRRYPSGSWAGSLNSYGNVDVGAAVKVPETTLTAGGANPNYSRTVSNERQYTENGLVASQPTWIAQGWIEESGITGGPGGNPTTINQYALSVWCGDCHNLNIGGSTYLTNEELGFKAHSERTHPAPFQGSGTGGPGQCYSCHRNDLSVAVGEADPTGYGMGQGAPGVPGSAACGQCHYGTKDYAADRAATSLRQSDFPHSGSGNDIKLLGSYTVAPATGSDYVPSFLYQAVNEGNLDAVCIRCHPGIGVHN